MPMTPHRILSTSLPERETWTWVQPPAVKRPKLGLAFARALLNAITPEKAR